MNMRFNFEQKMGNRKRKEKKIKYDFDVWKCRNKQGQEKVSILIE